ncbi:MAG TPA: ABC transporter permease [Gammaproteobacteria bacterium]|nr:ABC transporter permease [Gammaproteobacteria bacterium]
MSADSTYLKSIWHSRYFWAHLALADIRTKYRRSLFGLAWALIQPLSLTLLLAFIMGHFFHSPINDYAPFIFSGLIVWEFITSSAINGCASLVNAEGYIKQFSHPMMIYTLRTVIPCLINLFCAFGGLLVWILLWKPGNFGFCWLSFLLAFPLLFFFAWPISTITAFIGVRFRDFAQLILIALQIVYYVSPIFFMPKLFVTANLGFLVEYNPIYHLLNLFRLPLLEGTLPTLGDYGYVLLASGVLWLVAWSLVRRHESKVIFYL